jgi:translocation and assembly module TamA
VKGDRVRVTIGRHYWLAVALAAATPAIGQIAQPGTAPAQGPDAPKPNETPNQQSGANPAPASDPNGNAPIVPDAEFDAALPPLSGDINAPLEPMPADQSSATPTPAPAQSPAPGTEPTAPAGQDATTLAPTGPEDPQLAQPLDPLNQFNTQPLQTVADTKDEDAPQIRYDTVLRGLEALNLDAQFNGLSALKEGDGKAANATQVQARAREDEQLAIRLMRSLGYYDATAISVVEQNPPVGAEGGRPARLRAVVTATPGRLYTLSSVDIRAGAVTPSDLLTRNLPLKVGDPIEAARIQGAEANLNLVLPQQGYPFVQVGERDILLEDQGPNPVGAYTLPVETGPRSSFGQLVTSGDPVFELDHLNVFPRFKAGDLYDSRKTDDLRDALVATGLFSGIGVEPKRTGRVGPDGTEQVDLQVTQTRGPARTLAGQGGYSTGQGFTVEGSWTHRNLFPPEGALILTGVAGTQQQGASATFRRQNAGRRDRTFTAIASAARNNYDAYEALTGTLAARWSYDSTPIWQKPFTYYYGVELVGTSEVAFDPTYDYFFGRGADRRRTYFIAALPGQVMWDQSDSLLNPTKGFRLKLNASPETSVRGGVRPYVRTMVEGTAYFPVSDSLVIAGRARAGSIQGVDRDDLAPSRRYYGGGGGSVRGYGYQRLGPLDPNGNPIGGRSLNEFALEARYRFGNFGIVPFIDAGNSYESSMPKFNDLRFGAGIGGRFYTNFGPFRIDVATPLNRREGDGLIALYLSIGQAF